MSIKPIITHIAKSIISQDLQEKTASNDQLFRLRDVLGTFIGETNNGLYEALMVIFHIIDEDLENYDMQSKERSVLEQLMKKIQDAADFSKATSAIIKSKHTDNN